MKNKLNWLEAALLITPFLVLATYWNKLPVLVPVHWNIHGEIDGWASKPFGLMIVPVTMLLLSALLRFLSWIDPKLRRAPADDTRMPAVLRILRLVFAIFFTGIFYLQIGGVFGRVLDGRRFLLLNSLLLFAVMGNYLGNLRPNYFLGIRTPWTLDSPETWRATHRLGGRLMFFGAIFLILLQFFLNDAALVFLLLILVFGWAAWGVLYSWHHFRTHAVPR